MTNGGGEGRGDVGQRVKRKARDQKRTLGGPTAQVNIAEGKEAAHALRAKSLHQRIVRAHVL